MPDSLIACLIPTAAALAGIVIEGLQVARARRHIATITALMDTFRTEPHSAGSQPPLR